MDSEPEHRVETGGRKLVLVIVALLVGGGMIVGAFFYNRTQQNRDANESRLSAQSLCIVQNQNRKQTRANTIDIYRLVTTFLRLLPPPTTHEARVFQKELERREAHLAQSLKALKPINCETYVRPELPFPVVGVG